MHRINNKRHKTIILRFFTYGLTLTLSVITTVILVFIALGYRFDSSSGDIVRSGLLLVDAQPDDSQIIIDDKVVAKVPGRFILRTGVHNLKLEREGYKTWQKTISVLTSEVENVRYPLLIPNEFQTDKLIDIDQPTMSSLSINKKLLLIQTDSDNSLELITLDKTQPQREVLELGSYATRVNGNLGKMSVLQWHPNNRLVLMRHVLPSGTVEYLTVDVTNPSNGTNISRLYNNKITNVRFVGDSTNQVYGMESTVLSRYSIGSAEQSVLMQQVVSFRAYEDGTVSFTRLANNQTQLEVGVVNGDDEAVLYSTPAVKDEISHVLGKYDDNWYFVISSKSDKSITIYRNPLNKPIFAKQLPYKVLTTNGYGSLSFATSNRFVLVSSTEGAIVYDFENLQRFEFKALDDQSSLQSLTWLSGHQLVAVHKNGRTKILDFDGTNAHSLVPVLPGQELMLSDDLEVLFHFTKTRDQFELSATWLAPQN